MPVTPMVGDNKTKDMKGEMARQLAAIVRNARLTGDVAGWTGDVTLGIQVSRGTVVGVQDQRIVKEVL